jgi:GT2 family glycosyltransferase
VGWLSSFNLILWREVFDQAGHFDENLLTCEDVELGRRIDEHRKLLLSDIITIEHKGESKTLWEFFKKEYWHGTSSYMNFKRGPRKGKDYWNIIIPVGYFFSVFCFIIACIFRLWYPNTLFFYGGGIFLGFIFLTPLAIVTKLVKYSNSREFLQTAILCSIYLTARGLAIVSIKK